MKQIQEVMDIVILELTNRHYQLKSTDKNEDYMYASKTLDSYIRIIRVLSGNNFMKFKLPELGTKLFKQLVLFAKIAELQNVDPAQLMDKAIMNYSAEWCDKIFHKPYPPLPVLIGEKNILRLIRGF